HIVGAAFPRCEGHPAVIAPGAVVVVRRAANQIALRIVNPAQIRVEQGAAAGPLSLQIDVVGRAGHQGDRKPVLVAIMIDLARDRSIHRDRPGRADLVRVRVAWRLLHRQRVGALTASKAAGGHIVGAAFPRCEGHPAVIAPGAVVVVRRAANQIALRIVYPAQIRVEQGAAAGPLSLQIDAVGRAGHQGDRKPVPVARVIDLARDRSSDRDPAGRAGCRCVVV
ncbi:hypothetical protein GBAR_LOCUS20163, partial [Geodia barretti]